MLIRCEVANFRSILDPVELSMVAVDRDRPGARAVPNLGESVLTTAGIFGPNASGKSTILTAITALREAVEGVSCRNPLAQPFAGSVGAARPSEFAIEMLVDGVRFEYTVEVVDGVVRYEGLFHYPQRRRRRLFERHGNQLTLARGFSHLSAVRSLLTPGTLVLSLARRLDHSMIAAFGNRLAAIEAHRLSDSCPATGWRESDAGRAVAMVRLIDPSIDDVVIDAARHGANSGPSIQVIRWVEGESVTFDLAEESRGVRVWCRLVGPVLAALTAGTVLLVDDLDGRVHPLVLAGLIALFQDPVANPRGAQLVFTCAGTSLLNQLNRDEVWFTEKTENGATRLGALAEFAGERVRKSQNLEKAYLAGRFGGLPDVADAMR